MASALTGVWQGSASHVASTWERNSGVGAGRLAPSTWEGTVQPAKRFLSQVGSSFSRREGAGRRVPDLYTILTCRDFHPGETRWRTSSSHPKRLGTQPRVVYFRAGEGIMAFLSYIKNIFPFDNGKAGQFCVSMNVYASQETEGHH